MLEDVQVQCPFCGEAIWLGVDLSAGDQGYTEDCSVCCNPIAVRVVVAPDASTADVMVEREGG